MYTSRPLPFSTVSDEKTEVKAASASGAETKIAGRKSRKVCTTERDARNTPNTLRGTWKERYRGNKVNITVFGWMPGTRPVKVPQRIPMRKAAASRSIPVILAYSTPDLKKDGSQLGRYVWRKRHGEDDEADGSGHG